MKKVAVIGAGIFGVTTAVELSKKFQVTLFDKENDIFKGATFVNQYRHHMGYHYPRSLETLAECKQSRKDFQAVFGKALVPTFPYYYSIAKRNSKTSVSNYLKFCKQQQLPFKLDYPDEKFLNPRKIAACLKVPETVYDFKTLKNIAKNLLKNSKNIEIKMRNLVTGGEIKSNKKKTLYVTEGGKQYFEDFDYVVNATYSNYNLLCKAFGFEKKPLQFELVELLVVKLPIEGKIGITVMDGPFTCVLPMGNTGYFTLGHVEASIHKREIVAEEETPIVKKWGKVKSKKDKVIKDSLEFIPILKDASYVKSLYITRVVNPENELDDGRPTELKNHGYGFFSIFAGKIITCVTTAKQLFGEIEAS